MRKVQLRESDESTKFELFQRLDTGGSPLSDQEMRNSLLVMLNRDLFRWMKDDLAAYKPFVDCVALSDRALYEQYDLELVLRFLVFRSMAVDRMTHLGDLGDFLTDKAREIAQDKSFDRKMEEAAFKGTFDVLSSQLLDDAFRRYDATRNRFVGGFSISAFEVVALGVGYNYKKLFQKPDSIPPIVQRVWTNPVFVNNSGAGVRASTRIPKVVPLGAKLFAK